MQEKSKVVFLGTRGSLPVSGADFAVFGGDTSCVLIEMGGEKIMLDAGSGIMRALPLLKNKVCDITVLLSHAHIDHIMGLTSFPALFDNNPCRFNIKAVLHDSLNTYGQISALIGPPLWPITLASFSPNVTISDILEPKFNIGRVQIETMEGFHPGGCTIYKLVCNDDIIIYCTDFEHGNETQRLIEFAKNASLLIYDSHFTSGEYESKRGWGHSTWQEGLRVAKLCKAKRLAFTHHHPQRTDAELGKAEENAHNLFSYSFFAKCGQEIIL